MKHLRLTQRIVVANKTGPVTIEIKGQVLGPGGCKTEASKLADILLENLPQHTIDHLRAMLDARANEPGAVEADPPAEGCNNHKFVLGGIKYETDGMYVVYYHWFFCQRCLQFEYRRFGRELALYGGISFNATPK